MCFFFFFLPCIQLREHASNPQQQQQPKSPGRGREHERGEHPGWGEPGFFAETRSRSQRIPMQLLILLLLYAVVCANFCSRQGTTAPAQSGSIKALRSSNIRRDGKRLSVFFIARGCTCRESPEPGARPGGCRPRLPQRPAAFCPGGGPVPERPAGPAGARGPVPGGRSPEAGAGVGPGACGQAAGGRWGLRGRLCPAAAPPGGPKLLRATSGRLPGSRRRSPRPLRAAGSTLPLTARGARSQLPRRAPPGASRHPRAPSRLRPFAVPTPAAVRGGRRVCGGSGLSGAAAASPPGAPCGGRGRTRGRRPLGLGAGRGRRRRRLRGARRERGSSPGRAAAFGRFRLLQRLSGSRPPSGWKAALAGGPGPRAGRSPGSAGQCPARTGLVPCACRTVGGSRVPSDGGRQGGWLRACRHGPKSGFSLRV